MTNLDEPQSRAPTVVIRDFLRESISISEITAQLWAGRWIITTTCVLGLLWGSYSVWESEPNFMATMNIMPAVTDLNGGNVGGAVGLLASFAGGNGQADSVPKFSQFLAAMASVGVAQQLDNKYAMLCRVFRGDCNQATKTWRERTGFYPWLAGLSAKLAHLPDPNGPRTAIDLAAFNQASIVTVKDKTTGMTLLTFVHPNSKFAAEYLSDVVRVTNDYVKETDRSVQRKYVDYAANRIATNTNLAQRDALNSLLLQQETKLMMTEVDVPYAATVVDGPTVVPVNPAKRILAINFIIGFVVGILITYATKYFSHLYRRRP